MKSRRLTECAYTERRPHVVVGQGHIGPLMGKFSRGEDDFSKGGCQKSILLPKVAVVVHGKQCYLFF